MPAADPAITNPLSNGRSFAKIEVAELGLSAALRVRSLAWHHRDPFDRLLIAQALDGGFTIVTRDDVFDAYGVPVLRA